MTVHTRRSLLDESRARIAAFRICSLISPLVGQIIGVFLRNFIHGGYLMGNRICGSSNVRVTQLLYSKAELVALGVSEKVAERRPEPEAFAPLCTQVVTSAIAESDEVWLVKYQGQVVPFHSNELELCQ